MLVYGSYVMSDQKSNQIIPNDHPRAQSLHYRHALVEGMENKIVTPSGLCAHGRGEAYDYILGEITTPVAEEAMQAAIATIMCAKRPVISVNGNVAALVPKEIIEFSEETGALLEVNLFYQASGRLSAIEKILRENGAHDILGLDEKISVRLNNLSSNRRIVDPNGIFAADVVVIPLEDGDRAEALIESGKTVITIDLNPLSRTAQKSHITIVDNLIRCVPKMVTLARSMKNLEAEKIKGIKNNFNQKKNLDQSLTYMIQYLQSKLQNS